MTRLRGASQRRITRDSDDGSAWNTGVPANMPAYVSTTAAIEEILGTVTHRLAARTIIPDASTWAEAGALASLLTRLQQHGPSDRRAPSTMH